jgi:signal transduction histidine kinase
MNSFLRKLRRKYVVTSSVIVFTILLIMMIVINLLMRMTYRQEESMIENTVEQAAVSHINQPYTEHFDLSEAEMTEAGEYVIPRSIQDIANITVYGNISCSDESAIWYSAGGGILFEAVSQDTVEMVYKDYTFNKDTMKVSIDFTSCSMVKCGYEAITIDEEDITGTYFLVSGTWWKVSSSVSDGTDENVSLYITAIDIQYKENRILSDTSGGLVSHISFSDVFDGSIPELLNNTGVFYLITDSANQLVSVNDGNLTEGLANSEARSYISQIVDNGRESGKIYREGSVYSYKVYQSDDRNLIIFVNDSFVDKASNKLLWITVLVGLLILVVLFVIIFIVSGYVIRPLEKNMEQQKQFLSNASHELKTPITVIATTIDIISNKTGEDCWTECIREQAKKMQKLVLELLDLSRLLEVHSARKNFAENNVSVTVSNALLYFECMFFENEKVLRQYIEKDVMLKCDEDKISQLVGILVDNALKYSDTRSTIEFRLTRENNHAVIRCTNTCKDMSLSDTSRLFERFYRSDNDRTHEQEGFGLGLSIAQAITELHGGTIKAEYSDGKVIFTVRFPIK